MYFPIKKATKRSIGNRKKLFGVGINDAPYMVKPSENGKRYCCPYYSVWQGMLERCYSDRFHKIEPSYKDCIVCNEWLYFMNFREWMEKQDWQGKAIDKYILSNNNKIYSPETCCFVPQRVNNLLTDRASKRGKYPIGVFYKKANKKFMAQVQCSGINKYLGLFTTPEDAHAAYVSAKREIIIDVAKSIDDKRVASALIDKANALLQESLNAA